MSMKQALLLLYFRQALLLLWSTFWKGYVILNVLLWMTHCDAYCVLRLASAFLVFWPKDVHFCSLFLKVMIHYEFSIASRSFNFLRDLVCLNIIYPERKGSFRNTNGLKLSLLVAWMALSPHFRVDFLYRSKHDCSTGWTSNPETCILLLKSSYIASPQCVFCRCMVFACSNNFDWEQVLQRMIF